MVGKDSLNPKMETQQAGQVAAKLIATLAQPTPVKPAITNSRLAQLLATHDWKFKTLNDPKLAEMLNASIQFCTDLANNTHPYWLTFAGKSGTGKTHLAKRIASFFTRALFGSSFVPQSNVVRCRYGKTWDWKLCVNEMRNADYSSVEPMSDDWFCGIDDIGSERDPTKFATDKLLEVLNQRRDKWAVITSNLMLDEIGEHMDVRLSSRLLRDGSKVVQVDAQDYNLRRA